MLSLILKGLKSAIAVQEVVPVLNKIDLPQADAMGVAQEIEDIVGIEAVDAVQERARRRRAADKNDNAPAGLGQDTPTLPGGCQDPRR